MMGEHVDNIRTRKSERGKNQGKTRTNRKEGKSKEREKTVTSALEIETDDQHKVYKLNT